MVMRVSNTLRGITFDLWDTLVVDDSDEPRRNARGLRPKPEERVHILHAAFGPSGPQHGDVQEAVDAIADGFMEAWHGEQVTWTVPDRLQRVLDKLRSKLPPQAAAAVIQAWEELEMKEPPDPVAGAREALGHLAMTHRIGVVSDTIHSPGRCLRRILAAHSLDRHVQGWAFSNEVGRSKPHPSMFNTALDALELPPEEAVHVGDRENKDVQGAHHLGMKAVLFVGARDADLENTRADAVCHRLSDLPDVVASLQ